MKYCYKCGETKEEKEFRKSKVAKDKLLGYCKDCEHICIEEYKENHPGIIKEERIRSRRKCSIKIVLTSSREYILKSKYGITLKEYIHLYNMQNGLCAICHKKEEKDRILAVDHDHKTKKVRGLLCKHCNLALGSFNDNIESLKSAIRYLENDDSNA